MGKLTTIPLGLGGQHSSGDPVLIPDGYVTQLTNFLIRPGRLEARPASAFDATASGFPAYVSGAVSEYVTGMGVWEDLQNLKSRFFTYIGTPNVIVLRDAAGNYTTTTAAVAGGRMLSYANFLGKLYIATDDGATKAVEANGGAMNVFDGVTNSSSPFNSTIVGRAIASFGSRLFIASPRVTTTALGTALTNSYDWTNTSNWSQSNVNTSFATQSTGVVAGFAAPTSLTQQCSTVYAPGGFGSGGTGLISLTASSAEQFYVWRGDFRGTAAQYQLPYTLEWVLIAPMARNTAYAVGDLLTSVSNEDGEYYRYRCKVAGTTDFNPTNHSNVFGSVSVDGTASWVNEGSIVLESKEGYFGTASDDWEAIAVRCVVPPHTNTVYISPRLKFYNSTDTLVTELCAVQISQKDGIADGDARKKNKGQQWTAGDYIYPFFNKESATTNTQNLEALIWSEILDPKSFRGANYYEPKEQAGLATGLVVLGGRLYLFKRRAFWSFSLQGDPDIPIVEDAPARVGIGCIHPRAMDKLDDEIFFIGEDEVYRMRAGGDPEPICGDAMRETIFGTITETGEAPLLAIDAKNRDVYVYDGASAVYVYNLQSRQWSTLTFNVSSSLNALGYDPVGHAMVISGLGPLSGGLRTYGFGRLTGTGGKDTFDSFSALAPLDISHQITLRPLALRAPRYDLAIHSATLYEKVGSTYRGEDQTMTYAYKQGATSYSKTVTQDEDVSGLHGGGFVPVRFPAFQHADSVTLTWAHVGSTGSVVIQISQAEALIEVKKGEYPKLNPAAVSNTL